MFYHLPRSCRGTGRKLILCFVWLAVTEGLLFAAVSSNGCHEFRKTSFSDDCIHRQKKL